MKQCIQEDDAKNYLKNEKDGKNFHYHIACHKPL